jgi:prepilin-type N-terminal cleavage/methylation domain-containing protein/prepilin-type processing-associated H-X9-DG protein
MRSRGFTLIELLVVIAIIAILAAILFPVFARARDKVLFNRCVGNLEAYNRAFWAYTDDFGGRTPLSSPAPVGTLLPYMTVRILPEEGNYECAETASGAPVAYGGGSKVAICYLFNREFMGRGRDEILRGELVPLAAEGNLASGVFSRLDELEFPHKEGERGAVLYADGHARKRTKFDLTRSFSIEARTVPLPPGAYTAEELQQLGAVTVIGKDGRMELRAERAPKSPGG